MTRFIAIRLIIFISLASSASTKAAESPYPAEYYKYYSKANPLFLLPSVDTPPAPVKVTPIPASGLKDLKPHSSVVVEFVISKTGDVEYPLILKSSDTRLNEPTIAGVKTWKFKPATKKGQPVNCRVAQELEF